MNSLGKGVSPCWIDDSVRHTRPNGPFVSRLLEFEMKMKIKFYFDFLMAQMLRILLLIHFGERAGFFSTVVRLEYEDSWNESEVPDLTDTFGEMTAALTTPVFGCPGPDAVQAFPELDFDLTRIPIFIRSDMNRTTIQILPKQSSIWWQERLHSEHTAAVIVISSMLNSIIIRCNSIHGIFIWISQIKHNPN